MKSLRGALVIFTLLAAFAAHAAGPMAPLDLQKEIAYGQGRFGAFYVRCGEHDQKAFIGGTLANWRAETFRGYQGDKQSYRAVEQAFNAGAAAVNADPSACKDWAQQAAITWKLVARLAHNGATVAAQ